jgi:hypothetical protein
MRTFEHQQRTADGFAARERALQPQAWNVARN